MQEIIDGVGPYIMGLLVVGLPLCLAWWLSDGFENCHFGSGHIQVVPGYNPYTNSPGTIVVDADTRAPLAFLP